MTRLWLPRGSVVGAGLSQGARVCDATATPPEAQWSALGRWSGARGCDAAATPPDAQWSALGGGRGFVTPL